MAVDTLACGPLPGTRLGTLRPGTVLLLCQCCRRQAHVMAEAQRGKLIIQPSASAQHGERHYVVLGLDLCERFDVDQKIWCVCCDQETEGGRVLAEIRDRLLIIRAYRHRKQHFVALTAERLHMLLAPERREA
jgi:hypothetical protein